MAGMAAATLTTAAYVPQAAKIIKTRSTESISLITYIMLFSCCILWVVYGISRIDYPIIIANSITGLLCGTILYLKIKGLQQSKQK